MIKLPGYPEYCSFEVTGWEDFTLLNPKGKIERLPVVVAHIGLSEPINQPDYLTRKRIKEVLSGNGYVPEYAPKQDDKYQLHIEKSMSLMTGSSPFWVIENDKPSAIIGSYRTKEGALKALKKLNEVSK
jgi:hypothetical protein